MNHARHTFYISSVYKVNRLAYSTACSPPHWLAGALVSPRGMTLRLERPISRDTRSAFEKVKALYVKNLPDNITSEKLKELFERHGEVTKVVLPLAKAGQSKRDFGFIHFADRSSALKAVKETEKYELDGHVLDVSLAKPQTDKKYDPSPYSYQSSVLPGFLPTPGYGFGRDPYGALGAGYGNTSFNQPVIYGRGPMPAGMQMVPMILPDGRVGYVLQQPGAQASMPPPSRRNERRSDRSSGSRRGDSGGGGDGRRYRPY